MGNSRENYLNPSKNPHGRVVITDEPAQRAQFYQLGNDPRVLDVNIENYGNLKVFKGKDIVSFMHPKYQDHEVLCDSLEKVNAWFKEWVKEEKGRPTLARANFENIIDTEVKDVKENIEKIKRESSSAGL